MIPDPSVLSSLLEDITSGYFTITPTANFPICYNRNCETCTYYVDEDVGICPIGYKQDQIVYYRALLPTLQASFPEYFI